MLVFGFPLFDRYVYLWFHFGNRLSLGLFNTIVLIFVALLLIYCLYLLILVCLGCADLLRAIESLRRAHPLIIRNFYFDF